MSETITKEELEEKIENLEGKMAARRLDQGDEDGTEFDQEANAAYGTGVQPGPGATELTGVPEPPEAAKRARKRVQASQSDDPADYGTGVQGEHDPDLESDLTAGGREDTPSPTPSTEDDNLPSEAYGTGVQGDTSRQEYLEKQAREERAEILADAIAKADERREGE